MTRTVTRAVAHLADTVDDELTSVLGDEATVSARYNFTVYDAAYLELAIRLHVPLATNDRSNVAAGEVAKLPPILGNPR